DYVLPSRFDLGLRALCAQIGLYKYVERLVPGCCVTPIPHGAINGDLTDELLESQEALGDLSKAVKRGDLNDMRMKSQASYRIAARAVMETAEQMRKANGRGL